MFGERDDTIIDELLAQFPGLRSGLGLRTGLGGWLLLFIAAQLFLVVGAIYRMGEIIVSAAETSRLSALHPSYVALTGEFACVAFVAAGTLYGLLSYARLDAGTRRYWLEFLPATAMTFLIARFLGTHRYDLASGIGRYELATFMSQPRTWAAIIQPVAWTGYWARSKRVRATFRRKPSKS